MSIIIRSKEEGFRRCGIAHSAKPVVYPDDYFSNDALATLQDEPMLMVTEMEFALPSSDDSHDEIDSFAQGFADDFPELLEFIGQDHTSGWPKSAKIEALNSALIQAAKPKTDIPDLYPDVDVEGLQKFREEFDAAFPESTVDDVVATVNELTNQRDECSEHLAAEIENLNQARAEIDRLKTELKQLKAAKSTGKSKSGESSGKS